MQDAAGILTYTKQDGASREAPVLNHSSSSKNRLGDYRASLRPPWTGRKSEENATFPPQIEFAIFRSTHCLKDVYKDREYTLKSNQYSP